MLGSFDPDFAGLVEGEGWLDWVIGEVPSFDCKPPGDIPAV